jgi:hypothetical protein
VQNERSLNAPEQELLIKRFLRQDSPAVCVMCEDQSAIASYAGMPDVDVGRGVRGASRAGAAERDPRVPPNRRQLADDPVRHLVDHAFKPMVGE